MTRIVGGWVWCSHAEKTYYFMLNFRDYLSGPKLLIHNLFISVIADLWFTQLLATRFLHPCSVTCVCMCVCVCVCGDVRYICKYCCPVHSHMPKRAKMRKTIPPQTKKVKTSQEKTLEKSGAAVKNV